MTVWEQVKYLVKLWAVILLVTGLIAGGALLLVAGIVYVPWVVVTAAIFALVGGFSWSELKWEKEYRGRPEDWEEEEL